MDEDDLGVPGAGWALEESEFWLMSAYWALTPNAMYSFDPSARPCVDSDDRWVAVARYPSYLSYEWSGGWDLPAGDLTEFNQSMWDQVVAHPWRFDRWGPIGAAEQEPHYRGVALFGDQIATTSAACDTRPNIIQISGNAVAPLEWPIRVTEVCVRPSGIEPLPQVDIAMWGLPIGGVYALDGNELVITLGDYEYRYIPIGVDEYVADFDREAFFPLSDPLNELQNNELESFDELDNPRHTTSTTMG